MFLGKRDGLGFSIYIEVLSIGHFTLNPLSFFFVIRDFMQWWQKVCPHIVSNLGGLFSEYYWKQAGQLNWDGFINK